MNTDTLIIILIPVLGAVVGGAAGLGMKYRAERSPHIAFAYIALGLLLVMIPMMRFVSGFGLESILVVSLSTMVGVGLLYIEFRVSRSVFLRSSWVRSRRKRYWAKHIAKLKAKGADIREQQGQGRLPSTRELSEFGVDDSELKELGLRE